MNHVIYVDGRICPRFLTGKARLGSAVRIVAHEATGSSNPSQLKRRKVAKA